MAFLKRITREIPVLRKKVGDAVTVHLRTDTGAQERERWVPVTERLPENERFVLCVNVNNDNMIYVDRNDRFWDTNATHWRELPAPPAEKE